MHDGSLSFHNQIECVFVVVNEILSDEESKSSSFKEHKWAHIDAFVFRWLHQFFQDSDIVHWVIVSHIEVQMSSILLRTAPTRSIKCVNYLNLGIRKMFREMVDNITPDYTCSDYKNSLLIFRFLVRFDLLSYEISRLKGSPVHTE